ncbi:MAG: Nif3-like dinuclear metal center hexameric protein [Bacillota bacterium]|nr:Nif3-like dinuclear metal center hexameric protein [Bacillota bacterium]
MQVRVKDIVKIMEDHFPPHLAESWDNVGLQIGSYDMPVHRILTTLDLDAGILAQAVEQDVDLIITHHPLFFKGIKTIRFEEEKGRFIQTLIKADICVYSAHTNLDSAARGLNQILAEKLGLTKIQPLMKNKTEELYKLVIYVPCGHEEPLRQAVNDAGAGHTGLYSDCSFRTIGTGTFKPGTGTHPFIGEEGKVAEVEEYRLETIVPKDKLPQVLTRMKQVHPYEEVAYDLFLLQNEGQIFSLGRKGQLEEPVSLEELCRHVKKVLGLKNLRVVGNMERAIKKIAVVSGAGMSLMSAALAKNCDVLITGDLKYHEARDAESAGLAIIDAGHFGTESLVAEYLAELLEQAFEEYAYEVEVVPVTGCDCISIY